MVKIQFESIDSTNTYLKQHYQEFGDYTVVIAKHQTKGKGRLGRTWEDDSTQALFSILLKNNLDLKTLEQYPLLAAVAVHQVLIHEIPNLKIKWPNDIVINDLKVCGILTESVFNQTIQALIIGIGININTATFQPELCHIATSLYQNTNQIYNIEDIIDQILTSFDKVLKQFFMNPQSHIDYCNLYASLTNRFVTFSYHGSILEGTVIEINPFGELTVRTSSGLIHLSSGEVLLKK